MVELINKIERKHQDYISWLRSKRNEFDIDGFISYVVDKKGNYKQYMETCRISFIDELPRSINRYLDEYRVDYQFTKQSNQFTNDLTKLIEKLKKDYPA